MKKSILIICTVLVTFSLTAFGYMNWSNNGTDHEKTICSKSDVFEYDFVNPFDKHAGSDFFYEVDSRFIATITKENLHKAKSIIDILPEKATKSLESFQGVRVSILHDGKETTELGISEVLNAAQLELLRSTDYSTNFYITADCKNTSAKSGNLEDYDLVYYMSVVPEKEAEFKDGHLALMYYLKENSKAIVTSVKPNKLQPGKVQFIVTKDGEITNVKLESTSGYTSIDNRMLELISTMPKEWKPATNAKGEKVDQQLVFSFGIVGC